MREWAFATSPHGLGIPDGGWNFTPREFRALADVHQQYATHRSDFFNAHFRAKDDAAFLAEDFVGGNREKRTRDLQREALMVQRANAALVTQIKKGAPPTDEVPSWAIGEYRGNVNG